MNVDRRQHLARGLRQLADLIEQTDLPVSGEGWGLDPYLEISVACHTREGLERAVKALPGRKEKSDENGYLTVRPSLAPGLHLDWWAAQEQVCEARIVGTKTVTKQEPVSYREVEVEEPVIEYDCPPLLRSS